eukprot:4638999-Pyramimonas_sp.AAC.1
MQFAADRLEVSIALNACRGHKARQAGVESCWRDHAVKEGRANDLAPVARFRPCSQTVGPECCRVELYVYSYGTWYFSSSAYVPSSYE